MEKGERINVIPVDFSRNNGPQVEGYSGERAHPGNVSSQESQTGPTIDASEGSNVVTFEAGSTRIDARTGKGNIFKGISQDNTSDSVWDKKQKFAGRKFATPADLAELVTEPLGQPRSRIAA